jgi:hypothetical protein
MDVWHGSGEWGMTFTPFVLFAIAGVLIALVALPIVAASYRRKR